MMGINGYSSNNIFSTLLKIFPNNEVTLKITDSIPAGLSITTDASCKEILHNRVASEFFRIEPWNSLSHSAGENQPVKLFHQGKELSPDEMPIQLAVWKGRQVKDMEIEFVWDDGIRKCAVCNSSPLFDDTGNVIGAVGTFEDITKRKKAEEALLKSEELFFKAFNVNPLPMLIASMKNGRIIEANESFLIRSGYVKNELLGTRTGGALYRCDKYFISGPQGSPFSNSPRQPEAGEKLEELLSIT